MKNIFMIIAACAASGIAYVSLPALALAETRVGGDLSGDIVWSKEGSPYILRGDANIMAGSSLTIGPGTEVSAHPDYPNSQLVVDASDLIVTGKPSEKASVNVRTYLRGSNASITNAQFNSGTVNIQAHNSNLIATSSIFHSRSGSALFLWQSKIDIMDSKIIADGMNGIYVLADQYLGSNYRISSSTFGGIGKYGIMNGSANTIIAKDNWWGSKDGPNSAGAVSTYGQVDFYPWLQSEPLMDNPTTTEDVSTSTTATSSICCSSVLFIPGLQASRLHLSNNTLWEPNRNADVSKLYLDQSGDPLDTKIYSGEPIDKALGLFGIYGSFMELLDSLVFDRTIDSWRAFGYDWRKPIDEVVSGSEKKATTTESLLEVVQSVASTSKTGKVTLVAHSNGGLVTKSLVKKLAEMGKVELIDKVISVAVPYLGTPEAIRGLLHGGNQSILGGIIVSESNARGLGRNMASAYSLLPSKEYFSKVFSPTIVFASTSIEGLNSGTYPQQIHDYGWQMDFIRDAFNERNEPAFDDTLKPIKGNPSLVQKAGVLHESIDSFSWPEGIKRWAIVGWNLNTTKGVTYAKKLVCSVVLFSPNCYQKLSYSASTTKLGDGTVLYESAEYGSGDVISIDLKRESKESGSTKHANILEASTTLSAVKNMILSGEPGPLGLSATLQKPSRSDVYTLILSTHSPVELHLYDEKGNHTGRKPLPPEIEIDDSFYKAGYEEQIPGTLYEEVGDGIDHETYITVSEDSASDLKAVILGTDIGYATFKIEKVKGESIEEASEYSMIPVNPLSTAEITMKLSDLIKGNVADSIPNVGVDIDGDGDVDRSFSANSGEIPSQIEAIEDMKELLLTLVDGEPTLKHLVVRMERIEDLARKGKLKQVSKQGEAMIAGTGNLNLQTLRAEDRMKLIALLEGMLKEIEAAQY